MSRSRSPVKVVQENGQIKVIKKASGKDFGTMFNENLISLLEIRSEQDRKLLGAFMIALKPKDKNIIYLSTQQREDICESIGISNSNLSRSLGRLIDKGWIIPAGRQHNYMLCPDLYWKGHSTTRNAASRKYFSYTVTYVSDEEFDKEWPTTEELNTCTVNSDNLPWEVNN